MEGPLVLKIHPNDNVVVALQPLPAGTTVLPGIVTASRSPRRIKSPLVDIPAGGGNPALWGAARAREGGYRPGRLDP